MRPGIEEALREMVVRSYGHLRACTDSFIEVRGERIPNHFNHRGATAFLVVHLHNLEKFFVLNGKDPESCPYFLEIRHLCLKADHQEIIEVPDLPSFEELLGTTQN